MRCAGGRSLLAELAFRSEKGGQDGSAALGKDAAEDAGTVVEARVSRDLVERVAGARFRVGAAVDDEGQPGLNHGSGTHRAGLQRHIEEAVLKSPRAKGL